MERTTFFFIFYICVLVNVGQSAKPPDTSGPQQRPTDSFGYSAINQILYPYGPNVNDRNLTGDDTSSDLILSKPMLLFSALKTRVTITTNGVVSLTGYVTRRTAVIPGSGIYVAVFDTDLNTYSYGMIYFRETTQATVLSQAKVDIQRLGVSNYQATRAIVVSYINIAQFGSPDVFNTFQLVLVTDDETTYAILNYVRLDSGAENTGFTETMENYHKFAEENNANNLVRTTNVGVPGKHVYRLTTVWIKSANYVFTPSLAESTVTAGERIFGDKKNVTIAEVVTRSNYPLFAFIKNITATGQNYSIFSTAVSSQNVLLESLSVSKYASQNSSFQCGKINTAKFTSELQCVYHLFQTEMQIEPSIKLTVDIGDGPHAIIRHTYVWLRNVSRKGFGVCFKEAYQFSGRRNVTINYIATAINFVPYGQDVNAFKEHGHQTLLKNRTSACANVTLKYEYQTNPHVYVTPVSLPVSSEKTSTTPLIAWVKEVSTDHFTVCAKASNDKEHVFLEDIGVSYLVYGNRTSCSYLQCPDHLECKVNNNNVAYCGCISRCLETTSKDIICGTDYLTYESQCDLDKLHCEKNGNATKTDIQIRHRGDCERYPYESGVTQLDKIPSVSVAFCKYIPLHSYNFNSSRVLHVQLSVSWGKEMNSNLPHDAAAVWSEQVTVNGFKACVLVAGRHVFGTLSEKPLVYWFVYQEGFSYENSDMESYTFELPTWYTGSQCVQINNQMINAYTKIFVSVEHTTPRKFNNAMTAWVEQSRKTVCVREFQNFDGEHNGVKLHVMVISSTRSIHITENEFINFRSTVNVNTGAVFCKSIEYNFQFPSLSNPTVLISGALFSTNDSSLTTSNYGLTTWIENAGRTHLEICIKSINVGNTLPEIRVSYTLLPALCEEGWSYVNNTCYKKLPNCTSYDSATSQCNVINSTLPTLRTHAQEFYLYQSTNLTTWLGLTDRITEGRWVWQSNALPTFENWLPGQSHDGYANNCAVVNVGGSSKGWEDVNCNSCAETHCEKPANLIQRSCKSFCQNGGTCVSTINPLQIKNGGSLSCQCQHGYTGRRCEN